MTWRIGGVSLWILFALLWAAHAQPLGSPEPTAPGAAPRVQPAAAGIQIEKMRKEIEKFEAEIQHLRVENQALGVDTRRWSALLGAIGGFSGAILTFLVGYAGLRLKATQEARLAQEKLLSQSKLTQDKELTRERQTLEIYRDLGRSNSRVQFAAASVLLQRLEHYRRKHERAEEIDALEALEQPTIIKVLVSVLKEPGDPEPTHEVLRKHIADNLVIAIGARVDGEAPDAPRSPLRPFD